MRMLCILLGAVLLLSGCDGLPKAREMGDMALLRTVGVDGGRDGVTVTASTGPRAKGLQAEGQPALILSAQGQSLSAACLAMQGLSENYVFYGYVDQLLLGEALAGESVVPVLDWLARDGELSLGARLWVVRGTAGEAVSSGGDKGVEARLSTLQTDGELGVAAISRTAGEVYADLLEQGAAYVPALALAGEGGAVLLERGYAILKGEALAGFLEGEAAEGLELLAGRPEQDILEFDLSGQQFAVRITGASTRCRFEGEGTLAVTCRVQACLEEYGQTPGDEERSRLERELEARETARLRAALGRMQDWEADCIGLGPRAALTSPRLWQALEEGWPGRFGAIDVQVRVEVTLHG